MTGRTQGILMLLVASLIWGTAFVAQSVGMEHVGPFTFNGARFLVGALVLTPVIWLNSRTLSGKGKSEKPASSKLLMKGGLYCGLIIFVSSTLQQMGILHTTVGKAGFITSLYIVIVPLLGLFLRKKVDGLIWGCVLLAVAGMYLLCTNESFALNQGDLFILLCAIGFATHILVIDHFSPLVDGVKLSALQFLACSVLSTIAALLFEQPTWESILVAWKPILYTGLLSCGVAYTFQILGQKYVVPVIASLILSLESVFAVLSGWIILNEVLTQKEMWGCVLLFIAILLAQMPEFFKKKKSEV